MLFLFYGIQNKILHSRNTINEIQLCGFTRHSIKNWDQDLLKLHLKKLLLYLTKQVFTKVRSKVENKLSYIYKSPYFAWTNHNRIDAWYLR